MTGALLNQSYGAYVVLIASELGWNKTALSAAFSLARFESGMLGPLDGWLIDRFGPRAVMRVGLVIYGLGFMLFSQVDSLTTFYVAFAIMALGSSLGGFMPLTVALVNWFQRRRATALAATRLGMRSLLFLRTAAPETPPATTGNILLDRMAGADIRWITPADYARRAALMSAAAQELTALGRSPYVIPEGGSNAVGSWTGNSDGFAPLSIRPT